MTDSDGLSDATRRAVLQATAGALGVGAMGTASAHEWGTETTGQNGDNPDAQPENIDEDENVSRHGFHALGSAGAPAENPRAEAQDPHYGAVTEIRVRGDYAYVGVFSSDRETPGRGVAIVDISDYSRAASESELETAQPRVVSFVRNNSTATAVMDVKTSDDGDYIFLGTQPYTALFTESAEGEAADPFPNAEDNSATASGGGAVAVDVADPSNPEVVARMETFSTGIHNLFHHRIGGEDYVFLAKGLGAGDTGVYVLRFDRTAAEFELINRWTLEGNDRQGGIGDNESGLSYCHDVEVHDDPRTGRPTAYVSFLGSEFHICDVSDPADFDHIGAFPTGGLAHFGTTAPTLVDGKRVAVASHEVPSPDTGYRWERNTDQTGTVFLIDAEGIYPDDPVPDAREAGDPPRDLTEQELDDWTWLGPEDTEDGEVSWSNFTLSPHNSDLSRHVVDGEEEFWLHQGHYHGGVRFLRLDTDTWTLEEEGWSRPSYGVPDGSKMQGLNEVTPFVWASVETNGVTLSSDINQGVHAMSHDRLEVGNGQPTSVAVTREDDTDVYAGATTNRVQLTVEFPATGVKLRDRLPDGWNVVGGDDHTTYERGGSTFVEFDATAGAGERTTFTYFARREADAPDTAAFGPPEVSDATHPARTEGIEDDPSFANDLWVVASGEIDRGLEVGLGSALSSEATLGVAAGALGMAAYQRDRILERARGLLDREE